MRLRTLFEALGQEVAIIFGRFNPPHKGHRAAWELASKSPVWFVGTNQSTVGPKDPLPYDIKVEAMKTVWPEVEGHIIAETSWLTMASKMYEKYPDATLLCFTDEDWVTKTIVQYNGKEGAHGFYNFKNIEQRPTPRISSATALRDAVIKGDRDAFSKAAGVDANTSVAGKPFFDLVSEYLMPYQNAPKKVAKKKVAEPVEGVTEDTIRPNLVSALKGIGFKGPFKLGQLPEWMKELEDGRFDKDTPIMIGGDDPQYDAWVAKGYDYGYAYGMETGYQTGLSAQEVFKQAKADTKGIAEGQLELNTPDPVVVIQDKAGNILDKLNLSIASQKYKLGPPQNIKNQLAHQNFTTVGNYVVVAPMTGQPQDKTTQGEGVKSKIAGAALAAANLLASPAQATEPVKPITIATVMIDGEVRRYNLGDKFSNAREAEQFITNVLNKQGLQGYQLEIKHGYPKKKDEPVKEAPIEMDPQDPMNPMIYGHDKANPGKLKYRMLRASKQIQDLAQRAENASAGEWDMITRDFKELSMNIEQIRHALDELRKMRSKGGVRSRGIEKF